MELLHAKHSGMKRLHFVGFDMILVFPDTTAAMVCLSERRSDTAFVGVCFHNDGGMAWSEKMRGTSDTNRENNPLLENMVMKAGRTVKI